MLSYYGLAAGASRVDVVVTVSRHSSSHNETTELIFRQAGLDCLAIRLSCWLRAQAAWNKSLGAEIRPEFFHSLRDIERTHRGLWRCFRASEVSTLIERLVALKQSRYLTTTDRSYIVR